MKDNQKVSGTYLGIHKFSGTIVSMRPVAVHSDAWEFSVRLDSPIVINGTERKSLCLYARHCGKPSSYSRFQDLIRGA